MRVMSVSSLVDWGCIVSEPLRIGVRPFVSIWACELEVNELTLPSASVVKKRGALSCFEDALVV